MSESLSRQQTSESQRALLAGAACYLMWGLIPLVFQLIGRLGVSPGEILAHRIIWGVPAAAVFVGLAAQWGQVARVLRQPRVAGLLALSAALIAVNWIVFIVAVNSGHVLETSLGYFINPLMNMAAGAILFRERIDRLARAAIVLALLGVALQALALGRLPLVSLTLAASFLGYGLVRKQVAADAQTGLFVECLLLAPLAVGYLAVLGAAQGALHLFDSWETGALLVACGPLTAIPLVLFSWAARRMPLSAMGFLQFTAPSITFVIGLMQGEAFSTLRAISFAFIWLGAGVFIYGAWRASRRITQSAA